MSLNDRQLEELAERLGETAAARLDADAVANNIIKRLEVEPKIDSWWKRQMPTYGAFAAAAVLVLALGILSEERTGRDAISPDLELATLELQALSVDELEEVFDSLSFDAPVYELAAVGLDDMSVGQLEELLQTMMED